MRMWVCLPGAIGMMAVRSRDGERSLVSRISPHAPRALRSSSIDELSSCRAHSRSRQRKPPLKSESLQKDHSSARYDRFGDDAADYERISPLCAREARRSELEREPRRASNSGPRGHCRAREGPMREARGRARRAIGGPAARSPRPLRTARSSSKTRTLRALAAKVVRERRRARARRAPEQDAAARALRHTTKIFLVMERE
ncbi:hypothetical protein RR46_15016 [Papilio xuthus]|uniref:Uncharacterized protein n=1 Tax=Papilio xuthus TaxID=66420 RepID=A0A194PE22_PAPXU|nr:hypothetical protein RR46_15016 [Papilio xuthus]